jgi:tripartite-type tricarboxylate transporter receptor subunit TctC
MRVPLPRPIKNPPLPLGGSDREERSDGERVIGGKAESALLCFIAALAFLLAASSAPAQTEEAFFRGRTIHVIIGFAAGGGFNTYGQVLAAHMAQYIPGRPTMIVENMPGAGTAKAGQYIYAVAPQDGTTIGLLHQGLVANQVLGLQAADFDVTKFNWIGRMGTRLSVGLVWHTAGVRSLAEARQKEVLLGGTAQATTSVMVPTAINRLYGTKFKVVEGYQSSGEMYLAMERGETQGLGIAGWLDLTGARADWVKDGKVFVLYSIAAERHADGPDVPALPELASNEDDRRILRLLASTEDMGRSFVAGPAVPRARVAALRAAFAQMMRDPAFLADARAKQLDIDFMAGDALQKMVESVGAFPAALAARAKEIVKP